MVNDSVCLLYLCGLCQFPDRGVNSTPHWVYFQSRVGCLRNTKISLRYKKSSWCFNKEIFVIRKTVFAFPKNFFALRKAFFALTKQFFRNRKNRACDTERRATRTQSDTERRATRTQSDAAIFYKGYRSHLLKSCDAAPNAPI